MVEDDTLYAATSRSSQAARDGVGEHGRRGQLWRGARPEQMHRAKKRFPVRCVHASLGGRASSELNAKGLFRRFSLRQTFEDILSGLLRTDLGRLRGSLHVRLRKVPLIPVLFVWFTASTTQTHRRAPSVRVTGVGIVSSRRHRFTLR